MSEKLQGKLWLLPPFYLEVFCNKMKKRVEV